MAAWPHRDRVCPRTERVCFPPLSNLYTRKSFDDAASPRSKDVLVSKWVSSVKATRMRFVPLRLVATQECAQDGVNLLRALLASVLQSGIQDRGVLTQDKVGSKDWRREKSPRSATLS